MTYEEILRPIDRFLALAVRSERTSAEADELCALYEALGVAACLDAAQTNQVAPLAAQGLSEIISADRLDGAWIQLLRQNGARVEALLDALCGVTRRLEAVGCRSAVIENGGILLGTAMPLAAFSAGDFDLLIDGAPWGAVQAAFAAEGFAPQDRRHRPTNRVEFVRTLANGERQWLNAGFWPFDRMWAPLTYGYRSAIWLARRQRSNKAEGVYVLAPVDALALVSIHTSLHFFVLPPGIRLHVDVDHLVRTAAIDWEQFVTEIRALGLPTRAYVSLAMAAGLLDTPVPPDVLEALYPGKSRWDQIRNLLAGEGTFVKGTRKLPFGKTLILDKLVSEAPFLRWGWRILFPPVTWMREHFERDHNAGAPMLMPVLYAKRLLSRFRQA